MGKLRSFWRASSPPVCSRSFVGPACGRSGSRHAERAMEFRQRLRDVRSRRRTAWLPDLFSVCSNCHSMKLLHYRDLAGIGFNDDQIKAIACQRDRPLRAGRSGQPKDGPATPASQFKSPFANDIAARAGQ